MKQKYLLQEKAAPSRLQRELSAGILDLIRMEKLAPGTRLAEVALAVRLAAVACRSMSPSAT